MFKKILALLILMNLVVTPIDLFAGRGFGSGFGLGLLGGALLTSAAYNNNPPYGYRYYPAQPYPNGYTPQNSYYGNQGYAPY